MLHLASLREDDYQAIRLTKALEQRALSSREQRLVNSNQSLLVLLERARCGNAFRQSAYAGGSSTLDERSGQGVEGECLTRLASMLGAPGGPAAQYLWGYVHRDHRGQLYATVHLWRRGEADHRVTMPLDERAPAEALAERLYRHLFEASKVGDLRIEAPAGVGGELSIDGVARGPFRSGDEFTLDAGEHRLELRRDGRRVAAARAQVQTGAMGVALLAPEGAASAPTEAPAGPSRGSPSALPWVFGGIGVAGLAGALTFQLLRRGAENDLEQRCVAGQWCFPQEQSTIDRSDNYATLSAVSLGVAAAGFGAAALYLWARPKATAPVRASGSAAVTGGVYPVAGGAGAFVLGRF